MCWVGERRQVQQHERELERPPRPVRRLVGRLDGGVQLQRAVAAAGLAGERVDSLLPHRVVGEPERLGDVGIRQARDPGPDPPERDPRLGDVLACLRLMTREARRRVVDPALLRIDPRRVRVRQRREQLRQLRVAGLAERLHVQRRQRGSERLADRRIGEIGRAGGVCARHLLRRHRRRLEPHPAIRPARRDRRLHADAMPDRQLDGVAVQHLEPRQLGAIDLGREPDRIDRPPHEHRLARRMLDRQRRLAQPPRHRPATVRELPVDEKQRHQPLPAAVAHEPANHHLRLGRIGRERGSRHPVQRS